MQSPRMQMFSGQLIKDDRTLLSEVKVSPLYPEDFMVIKDPVSLFNAGIARNGFASVAKMQEARAYLSKILNLDKFIDKIKAMLGDDFETYMRARDRRQALNQVIAKNVLKYKDSRRLTKEIAQNTSLLDLTGINLNDYLGLTIEKVISKLDTVIDNENHILNDLMDKYPGIMDIRNIYYDTAEYPLSEFVRDNIPGPTHYLSNLVMKHQISLDGLKRGEMIITGGIPTDVQVGQGQSHLPTCQETLFINLENPNDEAYWKDYYSNHHQKTPPTEHVNVSGPKHEYVKQLFKLTETAHVDIPETREDHHSRLLSEIDTSGAIVKPQNKPLFNKATHQQLENTNLIPEGEHMSLTAVCQAAHQASLDSIVGQQPSTQEKVLFMDKKMLTVEEAINILSHISNLGSGSNMVVMGSVFDKLTQEDREKVSAYFNNDLEFNKSFSEKFYAQLVSSQRIAEQNNPDHKVVNDLNARALMGERLIDPLNGEGETLLIDSFSAYKPKQANVAEKLSSLPGYVHSDKQLTEDIKEGNVILSMGPLTSSFLAVTPEGELILNELDPENYVKVRQVLNEMDEVLVKEFKDKEKFLVENSSLPPGMTLEVEEGATPNKWKTTIHVDGKIIGQFQISRSDTVNE